MARRGRAGSSIAMAMAGAFALTGLRAGEAVAQSLTWTGAGGKYFDNASWTDDGVTNIALPPGSGDSITFGSASDGSLNPLARNFTYQVSGITYLSNLAAANATLTSSSASIQLSGPITNSSTLAVSLGIPITLENNQTINATAGNITLADVIDSGSNAYGLTIQGGNMVTLSSANTYTGNTTIHAGTLALGSNGSVSSPVITIGDAGSSNAILDVTAKQAFTLPNLLEGIGTLNCYTAGSKTVTLSGGISPGNSGIGTLNVVAHALALASGSSLDYDFGTPTALSVNSLSDQTYVNGNLTLTSGIILNIANNSNANGQGSIGNGIYKLFTYSSLSGASAGNITSLFTINNNSGLTGSTFTISDTGTGVGEIDLTVAPEPNPVVLLAPLVAGALLVRRHRPSVALGPM